MLLALAWSTCPLRLNKQLMNVESNRFDGKSPSQAKQIPSESFTRACTALESHPFEGLMVHAVELKSVLAKERCNLPVAPRMFFTWLPGRECGLSKVGRGWDVLKRHKFSSRNSTTAIVLVTVESNE